MFGSMFGAQMQFFEALECVGGVIIRSSEQADAIATPRFGFLPFSQIPVIFGGAYLTCVRLMLHELGVFGSHIWSYSYSILRLMQL